MGDIWEYKLRKMEIAWELASRVIPDQIAVRGKWMNEETFLQLAQQEMQKAYDAVDAIFREDKSN
jgi:hypothetical protein